MADQPRVKPLRPTPFFADGSSARQPVPGAVAREAPRADPRRYATTQPESASNVFPFPLTYQDLQRGQERYNIYCGVCHGRTGDGDGMIVQRGFVPPPSLHTERLRDLPAGHFVNVIANGWGAMYSYADRVQEDDRWRIAGYIRALQLSRNAALDELPETDRIEVIRMMQAATQPTTAPVAPTTQSAGEALP